MCCRIFPEASLSLSVPESRVFYFQKLLTFSRKNSGLKFCILFRENFVFPSKKHWTRHRLGWCSTKWHSPPHPRLSVCLFEYGVSFLFWIMVQLIKIFGGLLISKVIILKLNWRHEIFNHILIDSRCLMEPIKSAVYSSIVSLAI